MLGPVKNRQPGLITQSELARKLGVQPVNITRAIQLGRMTPTMRDEDGRAWFHPEAAVAAYNAGIRRKTPQARRQPDADGRLVGDARAPEPPGASPDTDPSAPPDPNKPEGYNEARRRLAVADANKRELEVATRRGLLIDREAVLRGLTTAALALKDRLSGLGARVSAQIASETGADARRIKELLDDEVRESLAELRRRIDKGLVHEPAGPKEPAPEPQPTPSPAPKAKPAKRFR